MAKHLWHAMAVALGVVAALNAFGGNVVIGSLLAVAAGVVMGAKPLVFEEV